MLSDFWSWIGTTNPDVWAAGAGWATTLIALIASIAAFHQVREARRLREEQAQPYVVAYMEPSAASQHIIELAVKNFGTTAAHGVRITCSPQLMRTGPGGSNDPQTVVLFKIIPVLVPGQEWRTYWDSSNRRAEAELPDEYSVEVTYTDSHGKSSFSTHTILDWNVYKGRMWVEIHGIHAAAKALREIEKSVKRWNEFGGGLKVFARDGDAKDSRKASSMAAAREHIEALNARPLPDGQETAATEPDESAPST